MMPMQFNPMNRGVPSMQGMGGGMFPSPWGGNNFMPSSAGAMPIPQQGQPGGANMMPSWMKYGFGQQDPMSRMMMQARYGSQFPMPSTQDYMMQKMHEMQQYMHPTPAPGPSPTPSPGPGPNPYPGVLTPESDPFKYYNQSGGKGTLAPGMLGAGNPMSSGTGGAGLSPGANPSMPLGQSPSMGASAPMMGMSAPMGAGAPSMMGSSGGMGASNPGLGSSGGGGDLPVPWSGSSGGGSGKGPDWASLMGPLGSLLKAFGISQEDFKNPADAGMGFLNQIGDMMKPYFQPYINAGNQSLPILQGQFQQLLNNPGALMASMGKGFQQSPGYAFQQQQALDSANKAAAAGGMLGSPAEQQQAATVSSQLANQDYYNYLDRTLGLYGKGLGGEADLAHMGQQSSSQLAENLANALQMQALMAYAGQANQNKFQQGQQGGMFGSLGEMLGGLAPFIGSLMNL